MKKQLIFLQEFFVFIKNHRHSNLFQRVFASLILVPFVFGLLFYTPLIIRQGAVLCLSLGLCYEWSKMTKVHYGFVGGSVLFIAAFFLLLHRYYYPISLGFIFLPFFIAYFRRDRIFTLGQFYILFAMMVLTELVEKPLIVFWLLILIWMNDSFAYFVGKKFQGPKLWVAVSPKKTWSGFLGGVCFGTLFGGIMASFLDLTHYPYILTFLFSLTGHGGDLLESAVKRYYNVKDSGHIIPGHGGLLDRLDSFLAVLLMYGLVSWVPHIIDGNSLNF